MTHSGGQPHAVGYRGQDFVVTVWDEGQEKRIIVGWRKNRMTWAEMRVLETRPGWANTQCEPVADKATGDPPP